MRIARSLRLKFLTAPILLLALLIGLGMPGSALAQLSSGAVTGLVRDSSGANIPGAKVTLRSTESNVARETVSNGSGNYSFSNVPPGKYTLEFTAPNFQTEKIAAFELSVNQTLTVEGALQVGEAQTSVTVEAQGTSVESSTAELGGLIAEKSVHDLPLNGRNFTALLTLTAGVTPVSVAQNSTASNTPVTAGSAFSFPSVNGQGNRANYFMIDGMNDQQAWFNTYAIAPIVDTIQEFKVNSHNDAQFGQVTGGVINVATKAGTNHLHGSAWEYIRNTAFDAKSFFSTTGAVTPFHQNQFGGTLGGPIVIPHLYNGRDKTFFFVGAEGFHYSQAQNGTSFLVPTPAELNGDFSALLAKSTGQLFDPHTGKPFPNNKLVDANGNSELDPGALAFLKLVVPAARTLPNSTTLNAANVGTKRQTQWNYSGRIDQTIGSKDFIFFRYSGQELDTTSPNNLLSLTTITQVPSQAYGVSWVHMFGPTSSLQVQYGRAHVEFNTTSLFGTPGVVSAYGVDPSLSGFLGGITLMPTINISGYFSGGEASNPTPNLSSVHQWKATYMKTLGRHDIQAGGSWDQINYTAQLRNATETFAAGQTAGTGTVGGVAVTGIGDALASFMLGYPNTALKRNINITERPGGIASGYLQDSWKLTSRLTVNYGLRYDRTFIPAYGQTNTAGKQGGIDTGDFDFNTGTYILQAVPQACTVTLVAPCIPGNGTLPAGVIVSPTSKILHPTRLNFGPRLGLAYRVNDKMAIRGSYGIFYDNWAAAIQLPQNYQGSWPDVANLGTGNVNARSGAAPVTTYVSPHNPFGSASAVLPAATPFISPNSNFFIDPNIKNPYSEQYNFGIQQQFGGNTIFTLNYVGSQTHRLDIGGYYNTGQPSPLAFGAAGRANQIGINGPQANGQRYGNIIPVQSWDRSVGQSNYNALQASLAKSLTKGLAYTASYTWSKVIDLGQSGDFGSEGNELQDPYNVRGSRGVAAFNIPQVFALSIVYDLPFGKGKSFSTGKSYVDYVLGNWQVNAIFTARSGQNYTINASGDTAHTGNPGTANSLGQGYYARGVLTGVSPKLANPTAAQYFNTSAFATPVATDATVGMGNSPRGALQAANFRDLDMSVFRRFPIHDQVSAEFRAEAFNLPNSTVFGIPATVVNNAATFGTVTAQSNSPRQLQFALKLQF